MTIIPHQTSLSLFPLLKIKLKGCHFDTIEVIEAESQAVLHTLTEHYFQNAFKKMAEALGTVHTHGRRLGNYSGRKENLLQTNQYGKRELGKMQNIDGIKLQPLAWNPFQFICHRITWCSMALLLTKKLLHGQSP
jgi:hypothetical protein